MTSVADVGVSNWLEQFAAVMSAGDRAGIADLFAPSGYWRDLVAFGWTIATHEGVDAIAAFVDACGPTKITNVGAQPGAQPGEGFIRFTAPSGLVQGYVRLIEGRCLTLLTALEAIADHPEAIGHHRPSGVVADPYGRNWKDLCQLERETIGIAEQPYVLVVGGGQGGLALGARLRALSVPTLIIDRYPRVGDQWRSRYKSLTLHDSVWYDHLPYMPFPENWPVYTPKDKMGDWLELYADAMELNVWTGTELTGACYDESAGRWAATVKRDGEEITLHPVQLVMAVGNAGFPCIPRIPGAERFHGPQLHSSQHRGGEGLKGKRVAVIGANNSAHDIAADLAENGALPTMVQRSSTLVVRQQTLFETMVRPIYSQEAVDAGLTTERADLLALSVPMRVAEEVQRPVWAAIEQMDREFYDELRAAGFALDFAEDGAGLMLKYLRSASGYYIDVGASQMVIDGRIQLRSGVEIGHIDERGLCFSDGSRLDADVIIYATGFGSMEQWVERLISPEVAEKVGRCWGYGSGCKGDPGPWSGELRNMWKPTPQEGLWFMGGNLQQCRMFSRFLAQQLKARYEGLGVQVIEPAAQALEPA
jgi:putative flavoprotein involved in K+ transport